ncbi:MAG: hypothetical protein RLZZ361_1526 [Cyanobacteriota bacterium]|jgi:hypothetical protein
MHYLQIDSTKKKPATKVEFLRPYSDPNLSNADIKDLAGNLRFELNNKKIERNQIVTQLLQMQNQKSSCQEQDQCRNFRKQVKEMHQKNSIDPDQLDTLKEDFDEFISEKNLDEKQYLKPFVNFMNEQIQELEAKTKVQYTPKQAFAMYDIKNLALSVIDISGPELDIEKLNPRELSKMSKMVSRMREGFSNQATKLFPDIKKVFNKLDEKVSQEIDPKKAKLTFSLAKKPLEMANKIVDITTGNITSLPEAQLDLKKHMVSYYDHVSNLDEDLKKRTIGSTDAD